MYVGIIPIHSHSRTHIDIGKEDKTNIKMKTVHFTCSVSHTTHTQFFIFFISLTLWLFFSLMLHFYVKLDELLKVVSGKQTQMVFQQKISWKKIKGKHKKNRLCCAVNGQWKWMVCIVGSNRVMGAKKNFPSQDLQQQQAP